MSINQPCIWSRVLVGVEFIEWKKIKQRGRKMVGKINKSFHVRSFPHQTAPNFVRVSVSEYTIMLEVVLITPSVVY